VPESRFSIFDSKTMHFNVWHHLNLPASLFRMPVYFFALAISPNFRADRLMWSFILMHLLIYPLSNGYMVWINAPDRNDPKIKWTFYAACLLEAIAVLIGWVKLNILIVILLVIFGFLSIGKARLKQISERLGWFAEALLCGYAFLIAYLAINDFPIENILQSRILIPAALAAWMWWGFAPVTETKTSSQRRRWLRTVLTISTGSTVANAFYFYNSFAPPVASYFLIAMLPLLTVIGGWHYSTGRNSWSDTFFRRTFFILATVALNAFFIWFFVQNTHIDQL
jgi:hypothetical protein